MSFGFSVGDFIAGINLAFKVCKAIRGSPAEHKELTLQLEDLRVSLKSVTHLIRDSQLSPQDAEAAEPQLSRCSQLLRNLNDVNTKYMSSSLPHEGLGKRRKNPSRELRWITYKRDEFITLLDGLRNQIGSLHWLLNTYSTRMVQENTVILGRIEGAITAPLDQWPDSRPIRFIDALDRQLEFPFELCGKWELFQEFLKLSFKDSAGKCWVDAGRYRITDEREGTILTAKEWGGRIKPGMMLSMAMVLQKRKATDALEHNCPSCDLPYSGAKNKDLERVRCMKCATWFQISSKPRIEELENDGVGAGDLDNSELLMRSGEANESFDTDEIRFFRRLHVLLELSEPVLLQENIQNILPGRDSFPLPPLRPLWTRFQAETPHPTGQLEHST